MQRTQVIIVRHGETEWNIRGIRQGHLDSRLTTKGMAQAKALGARLGREKFTALYSSDLGRAVESAQAIANVTGHAILTDERLRERHLGIFQGLNAEEINSKYPEERRLMRTEGPGYVIPGGETSGRANRCRHPRRRGQRFFSPHPGNFLGSAAPLRVRQRRN